MQQSKNNMTTRRARKRERDADDNYDNNDMKIIMINNATIKK